MAGRSLPPHRRSMRHLFRQAGTQIDGDRIIDLFCNTLRCRMHAAVHRHRVRRCAQSRPDRGRPHAEVRMTRRHPCFLHPLSHVSGCRPITACGATRVSASLAAFTVADTNVAGRVAAPASAEKDENPLPLRPPDMQRGAGRERKRVADRVPHYVFRFLRPSGGGEERNWLCAVPEHSASGIRRVSRLGVV
jgi:hypothetical protein